jgi:hypothetical protein
VGIDQRQIDAAMQGDLDAELARIAEADPLLLSDIARS